MQKIILTVVAAGLLVCAGTRLSAENFDGSDDFNDNTIDLNKWSNTYGGFGEFTEINQRLELDLDGDGSAGELDGYLPWKANYGSYTLDWEVYYDVQVPAFSLFSGSESSAMGILVYSDPSAPDGYAGIFLEQGTDGTAYRIFNAEFHTQTEDLEDSIPAFNPTASLRIRWAAASTTLYCDYDSNGGADSWTNLTSWNIGIGEPLSWGMTEGSTFFCVLRGEADIDHQGESNPFGDNFVAAGAYPPAPLAVFRPASGMWALRGITRAYFGIGTDTPVYSDYDGDSTKDIAIFRPGTGLWAIRGITRCYFGGVDDEPVPGDYTRNGTAEIAIFRESTGLWAVRGVTRGYYGTTGDIPLKP